MTNKLPTVDIKGKAYVMVKDRILAFNELYKNGSIQTEIVSPLESKIVVVKAIVTPDTTKPERQFVDFSQATIGQGMVNTTAALENASTSAVGRALAYMGIGVIEGIASADEVNKAINNTPKVIVESDDANQDKCEVCGTTNQYHSPKCPHNPNAVVTNHNGTKSVGKVEYSDPQ